LKMTGGGKIQLKMIIFFGKITAFHSVSELIN